MRESGDATYLPFRPLIDHAGVAGKVNTEAVYVRSAFPLELTDFEAKSRAGMLF